MKKIKRAWRGLKNALRFFETANIDDLLRFVRECPTTHERQVQTLFLQDFEARLAMAMQKERERQEIIRHNVEVEAARAYKKKGMRVVKHGG